MSKIKRKNTIKVTGYTGKKHVNYIWIPKSKSDLKEYRDTLKLCKILQDQKGFFNDKTLGLLQVEKGAIFDGSLDVKDYIRKYEGKSIGNQSFVSNARMSMRMSRFFGWITRSPKEKAKYKLTARGWLITNFSGQFPACFGEYNESEVMLRDILGMRFYCINDELQYQMKQFKQRVMFNILWFLNQFEYMHNYEIVVSALTLANEEQTNIDKAFDRINRLRRQKINIAEALQECGINPKDNSSLTGVYDGPKVLCSLLKQLNLVTPVDVSKLGVDCIKYYKRIFTGSPLLTHSPKNVFKITTFGKKIIKEKLKEIQIWYEDLPSPREYIAAALILFRMKRLNLKILDELKIKKQFLTLLKAYKLKIKPDELEAGDNGIFDFRMSRDIPPEDYTRVDTIIKKYYKKTVEVVFAGQDITFEPKKLDSEILCIKCHPPRCAVYKDYLDTPNSLDSLASKLCPNDSIRRDNNSGNMIIDTKRCVFCLLCAVSCPVNAIELKDVELFPKAIPDKKRGDYLVFKGDIPSLIKINDEVIKKISFRTHADLDRIKLVKNFEKKIGPLEQNWDQVEFYSWVRNCLRGLGLDAKYTGGKGMKTRSDVTIFSPFPVAIEIKSPAEGKVNGKAIRQTDDAAAQLFQKFKRKVYTCAIGQEISPEAIRKADEHKQYRESQGAKNFCIPIISSKALQYIFLLHQEINFRPDEIELIFQEFHGEIKAGELKRYLTIIDKIRKIERLKEYLTEIDQIFSKT
ncbi:MAG: 4Fe-4S binding protein [Candidatus Omnitrophica bacterium]|nr:4Fe-4S binding protein [Candidatus Omnitrophota bacterium]